MAARYWVGGTNTWTSSATARWSASDGGTGGASVPTASDDVYFTAASGTCTVTLGNNITVNSLNFTGGNVTFSTANYAVSWNAMFTVSVSTATFNLGTSTLTCTGLGNVGFNITGNPSWNGSSANINVQGYNHSVMLTGWSPASKVFCNTLNLSSADINVTQKSISGSFTVANLTVDCRAQTNQTNFRVVALSGTVTCTGTLTVLGISNAKRVTLKGGSYNAASVNLQYVDFDGVTAGGAAAPFTGTSLSDCRVVNLAASTGIAFTAPVNRYWVGGSGNWSDTAHWSTTSGGAGGASVPLCQDTAYFDSGSGVSGSVSLDRAGAFTSAKLPSGIISTNVDVYPEIINTSNGFLLTYNVSGTGVAFNKFSTLRINVVSSNSNLVLANVTGDIQTFTNVSGGNIPSVLFLGSSGSTTLLGSNISTPTTISTNSTIGIGGHSNFTFNASGYNVTARYFYFEPCNLILGGGTWTAQNSSSGASIGFQMDSGVTLNSTSSTIRLKALSNSENLVFIGGGKTYNDLYYEGTGTGVTLTFSGSDINSFENFYSTWSIPTTIRFTPGSTTKFKNWSVSGSAGNLITVRSSTAGSRATLNYNGSTRVSVDYLDIRDISGTPNTLTWYVGSNSVNTSNNIGLIFSNPPSIATSGLFFGSNF